MKKTIEPSAALVEQQTDLPEYVSAIEQQSELLLEVSQQTQE